jgi:hypothetical protein
MQATNANRTPVQQKTNTKFVSIAIIVSFLFIISLYISNAYRAFQSPSLPRGTLVISPVELEEKYGLRKPYCSDGSRWFRDVRIKIVDGQKSKLLLADKQNFPSLYTEQGVVINAPEETKSQEIEFISGGNLFIIYPNSGNAITPETPVTILFGNLALEPISAR